MDEEQKYKLITCVDPTKITVPIRDRFAKLTLSSKKKQPEMEDMDEDVERNKLSRNRVSRNLTEELNNANDNTFNNFSNENLAAASTISNLADISHYINPLLRSGSIPVQIASNEILAASMENEMQPLQVSESFPQPALDNLLEYEISTLAKEVSEMVVSSKDLHVKCNNKIALESTLLMSTGSQRRSLELQSHRLHTCKVNLDDKEQCDNKEESRQSVCISLSSSEGGGSAITVTDSSISDSIDFDCMTSKIPESGHTVDAFLPNTFSNEKIDQMEAFLRDVSQQRRELEENQECDNSALPGEINIDSSKDNRKGKDQKKQIGELAYADTESMTSLCTGQRGSNQSANILDTMSINQIDSNEFPIYESPGTWVKNINGKIEKPCRLAHDETQIDTSNSRSFSKEWPENPTKHNNQLNEQEYSISSEQGSFLDAAKADVPQDSVVISETSSESFSGSSFNDSSCNNKDIGTIDSDEPQRMSQNLEIGTINISAKINIKIAISQMDSLEDVCEHESGSNKSNVNDNSSSSECNDKVPENKMNEYMTKPSTAHETLERTWNEHRQKSTITDMIKNKEDDLSDSIITDDEEIDVNFLTHAERLLNQLYGKSWKTPEVIRTLKRTSRTPKKADDTPSSQTSETQVLIAANISDENVKQDAEVAGSERKKDPIVEQSFIEDFSIFRREIVRTNLDSTRFIAPKAVNKNLEMTTASPNFNSGPVCIAQRNIQPKQDFKVPKSGRKIKCLTKRKQGATAEFSPHLEDKDSETSGDNASDDDTLDKTENFVDSIKDNKENKCDDDEEWCLTSDEGSGSRYKISRPKKDIKAEAKKNSQYNSSSKREHNFTKRRQVKARSNDEVIYLDLSKNEVTIQEGDPSSPPANKDANFNTHLEEILRTCKAVDKAKLLATPNTAGKLKRKLFTANFGDEDVDLTVGEDGVGPRTPVRSAPATEEDLILQDLEQMKLSDGSSGSFAIFNKHLEAIKRGDPIFKFTPPPVPATPKSAETPNEKKTSRTLRQRKCLIDQICPTPKNKYGFLKSLDVCVAKTFCHPDALFYRENYRTKKEELTKLLYELYNEKLFQNKLNISLEWNKKLCNTAGRCLNKKKMSMRISVIELSEKVLTSADRLRCTLIHELCHAATWIFNGEGGHGSTWKQWASRANYIFPEIPKIGVCHQYDIEYKYTYKCTLCAAKSHAHSKSKKVENIRCSFCHGAIEIFLNKKDKDGNILSTPVREPTGFAKFVKENYKQYKRPDLKHADVMKILSTKFAALKIHGSGN